MHAVSADRVIHDTCYCYGSFSYVFKLTNLTRFIVELMTDQTELTLSQRKEYAQHANLHYNCFRENRQYSVFSSSEGRELN